MTTKRIFTIRARPGDPLPARKTGESDKRYELRVLMWAVEGLTEEDAKTALRAAIGSEFERTNEGTKALLRYVFPDAEVR